MILCAGENLIDMIQQRLAEDGAPEFRAVVGGSPYNCARALGRLGACVGYMTPISTDRMGGLLADALTRDNVSMLAGRSNRPTSMALVSLDAGQPSYQFYREGVADRDFTLHDLQSALPESTQALHLGSISLNEGADADALAELAETVAAKGIAVSVDPNVRPVLLHGDATAYRARLSRIFAAADIIKISDEDLAWWDPVRAQQDAVKALFDSAAPRLLVLTRGADGMVVLRGDDRYEVPAATVSQVIDTVGAGDTLMAALLQGLGDAGALDSQALASLPGAALTSVLERAARAAAITCSRAGCNPPTRAELDA